MPAHEAIRSRVNSSLKETTIKRISATNNADDKDHYLCAATLPEYTRRKRSIWLSQMNLYTKHQLKRGTAKVARCISNKPSNQSRGVCQSSV